MSDSIQKLVEAEIKFKELQAANKVNFDAMDLNIADTKSATMGLIVENHTLTAEKEAALKKIDELLSNPNPAPIDPIPTELAKPELLFNESQENKGWGDAILFKSNVHSSSLKDQVIVCGGRSGLINNGGEDFVVDWNNLTFIQSIYPTGWGASMKQVLGSVKNCKFVALGSRQWTASENLTDGHPLYLKPSGDMLIDSNYFLDCGGNVQFANRPWENEVPAKLKLHFKNNVWSNCSWNPTGHGGGGSANLAMYSATDEGTFVLVEDCVWANSVEYRGAAYAKTGPSARGCIAVWNEAFFPAPSRGYTPDPNKYFSALHLKNSTIRSTKSDRSLISVEGTREVLIENLKIYHTDVLDTKALAPVITVDDREDNPQRAKYIKIDPIDAAGYMRINGEMIPLKDGYLYKEDGYEPVH